MRVPGHHVIVVLIARIEAADLDARAQRNLIQRLGGRGPMHPCLLGHDVYALAEAHGEHFAVGCRQLGVIVALGWPRERVRIIAA